MTKRLEITLFGEVQGINFRYFAKAAGERFGLVGLARNNPDGSFTTIAEGDEAKLEIFLGQILHGLPAAKIIDQKIDWRETTGEFDDFQIR